MATKRLVIVRTLIVLLALFVSCVFWAGGKLSKHRVQAVDETPISVAPASTPTERPWLEIQGTDLWGRSNREPDQARLLRALHKRKFAELTTWLEQWQAEFEADPKQEHWPAMAVDAFGISDPRLDPLLDEWVTTSPSSWAPLAARGVYRQARAFQARGGKFMKETNDGQLKLMRDWYARAREDLDAALVLKPSLVVVHRALMTQGQMNSDEALHERAYADAITACPTCTSPHLAAMANLTPRWGGSHEEMQALADSLRPRFVTQPMLALLDGYVDWDKCRTLSEAKRYADAKRACDAALRRGPGTAFLMARANASKKLDDPAAALADFDRVLSQAPQHADALVRRASIHAELGNPEQAGRDLATALRIDPAATSQDNYLWVVDTMVFAAAEREKSGDIQGARNLLDLAVQLSTEHEGARKRRSWHQHQHGVTPAEIDHLRKRYEAESPSISAARDLDDALLAIGEFDEILAIWTREIAAAPKDPRPYFERGGTYHQMEREEESRKDVETACRLGLKRACRRLE